MVEKQVKVEILAIDNHALLPFDEGEPITQLQYELLQVRHKAILQALLAIHPLETCKLKEVGALEDQVGGKDVVIPQLRQLLLNQFVRLCCNGGALIEHAINLCLKGSLAPSLVSRHSQIEFTSQRVFDRHNKQEMSP